MTAASIGSVLARCPSALAKARTWAGLTTTTGKPAAASAAATTVSNPPVASSATDVGSDLRKRATSTLEPCRITLDHKRLSTRTNSDVEAILRYVDTDDDRFPWRPVLA